MRGDAFLAQAAAAASAPAAREDLYCISRALEAREGTAPTHLPCGQPLPCRRPQLDTALVVDTALRRKVLLSVVLRPVPPVPIACASKLSGVDRAPQQNTHLVAAADGPLCS